MFQHSMQNAYIGEVWTPGNNTIAYYPFKSDTLDATGNTTLSGTMIQSGLGYKPTATCSGTYTGVANWVSFWIYINTYPTTSNYQSGIGVNNHSMIYYPYHKNANYNQKILAFLNPSYSAISKSYVQPTGSWHWIGIGYDGSKTICSIDGVSYDIGSSVGYNFEQTFFFESGDFSLSNYIVENVCWSEQQRLDYYNQTKSNYGL